MDWLGSRWERGWALLFHYLCESYLRRFECQCLASAASPTHQAAPRRATAIGAVGEQVCGMKQLQSTLVAVDPPQPKLRPSLSTKRLRIFKSGEGLS